eukprot:COSAG02_NODE_1318_length_13293_cov_39.414886_4_plen_166_part_00
MAEAAGAPLRTDTSELSRTQTAQLIDEISEEHILQVCADEHIEVEEQDTLESLRNKLRQHLGLPIRANSDVLRMQDSQQVRLDFVGEQSGSLGAAGGYGAEAGGYDSSGGYREGGAANRAAPPPPRASPSNRAATPPPPPPRANPSRGHPVSASLTPAVLSLPSS